MNAPSPSSAAVAPATAVSLDARVDKYLAPYVETRAFSATILIARADKVMD
jgi:hypothetical protein